MYYKQNIGTKMKNLRFRQIHLDFHTSPLIPEIGAKFDKKTWQQRLQKAQVNSITCFSVCHHGLSYHPTKIGVMHPHLKFDLLKAQIDACHEIDVNVPVYLTAGVNSVAANAHPEWRAITADGRWMGWRTSPLEPGFDTLCFNTPYLDYLCDSIKEVVTLYPECDGIFLDIIAQGQCCCPKCMAGMKQAKLDPTNPADRTKFAKGVLLNYYKRTTEAAKINDPDMPIFHNSGHITMGDTDILQYFSHLELESLPTGGWGYDHYPMSAAYSRSLGKEFLGMTGKFHTTWGEFGGYKHPNALLFECAAMIANGSKCSVGDQLHPSAELDETTYDIIGEAYRDVAKKEPWCDKVTILANLAVLTNEAIAKVKLDSASDIGASRILLEAHIPFDLVDCSMDFDKYKFLLLPDNVRLDATVLAKVKQFQAKGGKLILSGKSGMAIDKDEFVLDLGFEYAGESACSPDYIKASPKFPLSFVKTPMVMYAKSQQIKVKNGESLGDVYESYFNRTFEHFCSHQHTPNQLVASGYAAGLMSENVLYFAHEVFSLYRNFGAVVCKEFVCNALVKFMGDDLLIKSTLPSTARVTLMSQKAESRAILHLLFANTIARGGNPKMIEVIEELLPLGKQAFSVKLPNKVKKIYLAPENIEIPFIENNGRIEFVTPEFICHQMVVFDF